MVVLAHEGATSHSHSFLAYVKMEEAADLFCLVGTQASLFEPPDTHHQAIEIDLLGG
jgi:hypothetical protein